MGVPFHLRGDPASTVPRRRHACGACRDGAEFPIAFTMAFQPIVDVVLGRVFAYEALVRGPAGEPAGAILSQVQPDMIYRFDQGCRVKAIELAGRLFSPGHCQSNEAG